MRTLTLVLCGILIATLSPSLRAAPPPALADAEKSFQAGDYRTTLRTLSQILSQTETPASPQDSYPLLMLRGESLLRLGERTAAVDAFNAASRAAGRDQIKNAALARANAVLITLSQGADYHPHRGGDPINIVNPDTRPAAMRAAFEDLLAENTPKFKAALEGRELPPMLDLVPVLGDMYVLETAASGEPKRTTEILKSFGLHARSLMESELQRVNRRVNSLANLADSLVSTDAVWMAQINRRGLYTPERNELQELIDYTQRIAQAARRARQISTSFGHTGENWDPIIADATTTLETAQELWNHRY
jgi:hypothetical protein